MGKTPRQDQQEAGGLLLHPIPTSKCSSASSNEKAILGAPLQPLPCPPLSPAGSWLCRLSSRSVSGSPPLGPRPGCPGGSPWLPGHSPAKGRGTSSPQGTCSASLGRVPPSGHTLGSRSGAEPPPLQEPALQSPDLRAALAFLLPGFPVGLRCGRQNDPPTMQ